MIPHNLPTLGDREKRVAALVIGSGWVAQGKEVEGFERGLCAFLGLPDGHAVAVSSGTAALYLALWVLGALGKRVGVPVYSCAALRNAVIMAGGTPVYLDCAAGSLSPNVRLFGGEPIDIAIAPSLFGLPVAIPLNAPFKVIDDVAQALGAARHNTPVGLRGDVGICSFRATKLLTTAGQGGALVGWNRALLDTVRDYRDFEGGDGPRFNFQMTDVQAAVGSVQLCRFPEFIETREQLFLIYRKVGLPLVEGAGESVRFRAVMRCRNAPAVISGLAAKSIRAVLPLAVGALLDDACNYPAACFFADTTVSLPLYPKLGAATVKKIAQMAMKLSSNNRW